MPKFLENYKDKDRAREVRNEQRKRYYKKSRNNAINESRKYTQEEIDLILDKQMSDIELSRMLKRSVQAIQVKRAKLKSCY